MNPLISELEALLHPVGLVWVALLVGTVRFFLGRKPGSSIFCLALAAVLFIFGSTPLPCTLLARLESSYNPIQRPPVPQANAVVMLGGTHDFSRRGPLPFNTGEACDRILASVELIVQKRATNLVLGGAGFDREGSRHPDSELLADWFQRWKLPSGKVFLLGACSNTRDEAERTARLVSQERWQRILLVSSAYHLRRGEATFRKLGLDIVPVGCDFLGLDALDARNQWVLVPRLRLLDLTRLWIHEQIGWWYYRVKGWV
jgi:uncharacterized SAM-binding protein YcdF (DUF218 family)